MKTYFKYALEQHKGKVLDKKLISEIVADLELQVINFMYNEAFYLKNAETDMTITANAVDKGLEITSKYEWNRSKEYSTLQGALKSSNNSF